METYEQLKQSRDQLRAEVEQLKKELSVSLEIRASVTALADKEIDDLRSQLAAAQQALRFANGLLEDVKTAGAEMFREECRSAIDQARTNQ